MRSLILATLICLGTSCASPPPFAGPKLPREIAEPSGMVRSPGRDGVFWVHSDSGNAPVLHAVDRGGAILARVKVEGGSNVDWEDIAVHGEQLFIADIGNNLQARRDLAIHRLAEPGPDAQSVQVDSTIRVHFPEQSQFPADRPLFDAEALFWAHEQLWILSKQRKTFRTVLYRVPDPTSSEDQALERVMQLEIGGQGHPYGGMVTAADVDARGRYLAVLTYHALFIFDLEGVTDEALLSQPVRRLELRGQFLRQCESVAWDGADLIISNEDGRIFRVPSATSGKELIFPAR